MASYRRRPSLLGALLWTALGALFLLQNFGIGPDVWSVAARYWPVLLILLGLGKILEYFLKKDAVAIRIGEIVGIIFLLLIGSAISRISGSHNFSRIVQELPIEIGDTPVRPGQWFGDSHTYSEDVTYPLESPLPIRVENAYGLVSVTPGNDREIRVHLKKVVYGEEARAKSFASEVHLLGEPGNPGAPQNELRAEAEPGKKAGGAVFVLKTNRDSLSSRDIMFNTDMEISVPRNSEVQIVNSYGEIRVSGINGKLNLGTAYRPIELRDCTGQFSVTNRHAESRLSNLKGNVNVDGRGRVYIDDVKGDVTVADEYSPIEILNIDGNLNVVATEGNLRIEKVTKPVVIDARGTKVQVAQLQDSLKIKTSHRDVEITDVASQVTVESRYSTLSLKNVKGSVSIDSNSDTVNAEQVGGRLLMKARGSGIRASDVLGPLDIQTTLKDVAVNGFGDSCSISNEYAGISISSSKLGKGDLNIKNRNGDVSLYLPDGASFSIDATARNGSVESDYKGLSPTRNGNAGSLKARMKSGSPRITLETESSDIHIYRADDGDQGDAESKAEASLNPGHRNSREYGRFLSPSVPAI